MNKVKQTDRLHEPSSPSSLANDSGGGVTTETRETRSNSSNNNDDENDYYNQLWPQHKNNNCDNAKCQKRCHEHKSNCKFTQLLYQTTSKSNNSEKDKNIFSERRRKRKVVEQDKKFQISLLSSSVNTFFGRCSTMIYIFLMYLSMYSCMAARQEGKFKIF